MEQTNHPEKSTNTAVSATSWDIAQQFDAALNRTKDRLGSYLLTLVGCLVVAAILILIITLLVAIGIPIYTTTQSTSVIIGFGFLVAAFYIIAVVTLSTIFGLAITQIMIDDEKKTPKQIFQSILPLVFNYWWVTFISGAFIMGMALWGMLSMGIVLILWGVWSSFIVFVFLKLEKNGLENLWYSKAMINQRFWGILGRIALLNIAFFVLTSFLQYYAQQYNILYILLIAAYVFYSPFSISFYYEMYRNLEVPKEVKAPTGWIVASIIGWIFLLLIITSAVTMLIQQLPGMLKESEMREVYPSLEYNEDTTPFDIGEFEQQLQEDQTGTDI